MAYHRLHYWEGRKIATAYMRRPFREPSDFQKDNLVDHCKLRRIRSFKRFYVNNIMMAKFATFG